MQTVPVFPQRDAHAASALLQTALAWPGGVPLEVLDDRLQSATESCRLLQQRIDELNGEIEQLSTQCEDEHAARSEIAVQLDTLLEVLPAGVVVIDTRGIVRQCNPAARSLLGARLSGRQWGRVIEQQFAPRQDDGHEVSLKDGRRVRVATASLGTGGQLVLLTDLTETRQLQAQLSRHQRLQALGQMVSALAHQIRTPLSAAMLYASQLTQPLPPDRQQQFADRLLGRLHSMENQIRDMLLFVRGDVPLQDKLDVNGLLAALAEALDPLVQAANVDIRYPAPVDIAPGVVLRCHRDGLIGAVTNLANNAIQAGATALQLQLSVGGRELVLSLCDNGPGMDESTLRQAAEPFFTTRACGTGLGLAIVNTVVQAHGGQCQLTSSPGAGTCARITLPLQLPVASPDSRLPRSLAS